jgi:hypothetical protein
MEKRRMNVALEVLDTASQTKATFRRLPVLIGRDGTADVRLDDPAIPPYQCMIGESDSSYLIAWNLRTDIPIHVNGREVSKAELLPGDTLTIGKTQLVVHYRSATQTACMLS